MAYNPLLCLKERYKNDAFRAILKAVCFTSLLQLVRQINVNLSDSRNEVFPILPQFIDTCGLSAHLCQQAAEEDNREDKGATISGASPLQPQWQKMKLVCPFCLANQSLHQSSPKESSVIIYSTPFLANLFITVSECYQGLLQLFSNLFATRYIQSFPMALHWYLCFPCKHPEEGGRNLSQICHTCIQFLFCHCPLGTGIWVIYFPPAFHIYIF